MTAYNDWSVTFEQAYDDPDSLPTLECPNCGAKRLRMIFIVESEEVRGQLDQAGLDGADEDIARNERAMLAFWCDACLVGLPPNYTTIPDRGERVRRGDEQVPNYDVVTE